MIAPAITRTAAGWEVQIEHGRVVLSYPGYGSQEIAQHVAAELVRKLTHERPQQGELFPESA